MRKYIIVLLMLAILAMPIPAMAHSKRQVKRAARVALRHKGWSRHNVEDACRLFGKENGKWDPRRRNGPYLGIGQCDIDMFKCCSYHWRTRYQVKTQVSIASRYVRKRYGSFDKAWAYWKTHRAY